MEEAAGRSELEEERRQLATVSDVELEGGRSRLERVQREVGRPEQA